MSTLQFSYELTKEGIAKQNATRNLPRAHKKILTEWLAGVKFLSSRNANAMQKSGGKKAGGSQMGRSVAIDVINNGEGFTGMVGTGLPGKSLKCKYAMIQDKGGTIIAKSKYLTIPFKGVTGTARSYSNTFFAFGKSGNLIMFQKQGKSIKPLFTLVDHVTIPASNWFTGAVDTNKPLLDEMMKPENTFRYALANFGST